MTIEQLLCPAVLRWEAEFRKHLNESHIEMSDDDIADEFDKWLNENEDLVNKSVNENIDHINEVINRNIEKLNKVNESMFDDDFFDETDDDKKDNDVEDDEDEPISGDVESKEDETDHDEPEQEVSKLTGVVKLTDNKKSRYNIFGFINDFYDLVLEEHTNDMTHKGIFCYTS